MNMLGVIIGGAMALLGIWGFGFNAFDPIAGMALLFIGVILFAIAWKL